jgi:hypothetical protein
MLFFARDIARKLAHGEPIDTRHAVARTGDAFRSATGGVRPAGGCFEPGRPGEGPRLPGGAHVLALLDEAGDVGEWYVARCWEGMDGSYSLQVFVWPPETRTQVHDHTSWGVFCCVVGALLEERYERLDDASQLTTPG